MINQMQFSLLENILTVLFLIAGRSLDLLFMPAASQQGRFSHTDHGKSGRAFEKYKHRYLPDGLPPEHQCDNGFGTG